MTTQVEESSSFVCKVNEMLAEKKQRLGQSNLMMKILLLYFLSKINEQEKCL